MTIFPSVTSLLSPHRCAQPSRLMAARKCRRSPGRLSMTLPCPPAIDLLTHATVYLRPYLDRSVPVGDRLRNLWAAVFAARDLAACELVENEFLQVARDAGLAIDLGRHADDDLRHVIRWAMLGQNPFQ